MGFVGVRGAFLEPEALGTLVRDSELISVDIPRGPFSDTPILPSVAVARRALVLMQEQRGDLIFHELFG